MADYRGALPQLSPELFLTDSGLETTLIFQEGRALPDFAAFVLLEDDAGRRRLFRYFREHLAVATECEAGFVLETPTWRASPDWGRRLGYDATSLAAVNREAVAMLVPLRDQAESHGQTVVISGCLGPRGDGYDGTALMTAPEARRYHATQISSFADSDADMVHAMTITYPAEAIGIVEAAQQAGMPVAISFTVETDGALPDGTPLGRAIAAVDEATGGPAYFGVNCAHPSHVDAVLDADAPWMPRLRGFRANASRRSHAELDRAEQLDDGDPEELAREYVALRRRLPQLTVLGGCCGTDLRHLRSIAAALPA